MNRRIVLVAGTSLQDPTYARVLTSLSGALSRRGWRVSAFEPASERLVARKSAPALVHLHFSGQARPRVLRWVNRAVRAGAKLVLTFQDLDHPDMRAPLPRERAAVAALVARASAVTALSPELARGVRRRCPAAGRVDVIGNGVGGRWSSPPRRRDGPIVAAARLSPYKGTDLLLWAFASLSASEPAARLALFGADFQNGHYQKLARRLRIEKKVRFAGRVGDARLKAALARAPLAVSASRRETYGMAVLEAMAAGAPVLATRTGAAALLPRHGRAAWLVEPGNPEALAEGLRRLWRDGALRRRLSAGGKRLAALHGWDDRAARYGRIYEEALSGR